MEISEAIIKAYRQARASTVINEPCVHCLADFARDTLAELRKAQALLELPEAPHRGPCTPESGCDGVCMDRYHISTAAFEHWQKLADAELRADRETGEK